MTDAVLSPAIIAPTVTGALKDWGGGLYNVASTLNPNVCKCDAKIFTNLSITSGTTTVFDADAKCRLSATDVGKSIQIVGAGTSGAVLVTTISSFTDCNHVVVALAAGTTVAGAEGVVGTDDTAAYQATVTAVGTFGTTKGVGLALLIPSPMLILGTITYPTATGGPDLSVFGIGFASVIHLGTTGTLVGTSTTRLRHADLKIKAFGAGGNGSYFAQSANETRLVNVRFEGGGHHINLNNCSYALISSTQHKGHSTAGKDMFLYQSHYLTVLAPIVEGSVIPVGGALSSIGLQECDHCDVIGGSIIGVDFTQCTNGGGVVFSGSTWCTVTGTVVTGLKNGDGIGTEASGSNAADIDIVGCNSSQNNVSTGVGSNYNNGDGFDIFNANRVRLVGCTGRANGSAGTTTHINCEIYTSSDVTVDGCDFSDGGDLGMTINGTPDCTVANTVIRRNVKSGIYVHDNGSLINLNLKIIGCDISDNNQGGFGAGINADGIYLADAAEALIAYCRLTDTAPLATKKQNYAIEIQNTAFARIIGCDVRGNKTAGVNDAVGLSQIKDCPGVNPQGVSTMSAPASGVVTSFPVGNDGVLLIGGGTITAINLGGLPTPAVPTLTGQSTGGTLATATYGYKYSALGPGGETIASAEVTVAVTGPTGAVVITVPRMRGARGYYIYGRTSGGAWNRMGFISQGLRFVDDGSVTPSAPAAPTTDNSGSTATGITAAAAAGSVHNLPADYGGAIAITYSVAPTSLKLVVR